MDHDLGDLRLAGIGFHGCHPDVRVDRHDDGMGFLFEFRDGVRDELVDVLVILYFGEPC
jgi:hypothetical protein